MSRLGDCAANESPPERSSASLLVTYQGDLAGHNMARHLSQGMSMDGDVLLGQDYDLVEIPTPAIQADWLESKYQYGSYIFLSKHAAKSGMLALTCHTTGNFARAEMGGQDRQVAVPYPGMQKRYLTLLKEREDDFTGFEITIEATHHGPTALSSPSLFIEVGTGPDQWKDEKLCSQVADVVDEAVRQGPGNYPIAICFGGTHYPDVFTKELLSGEFALGTVMPRSGLAHLDNDLLNHILERNSGATAVLLDWKGLGPHKRRVVDLLDSTGLEVIRL